jgi:hypothetical protein
MNDRLPRMNRVASWYLKVPCNSCDCERSLSKYNILFSPTRRSMSQETIIMNNFFFFNNFDSDEIRLIIDNAIVQEQEMPDI